MLHLIIYLVIWLIGYTYYLYVYIELIYICIKPTFVHWFTLTAHSFFFVVVYIHLSKSQIVSYYFGYFFFGEEFVCLSIHLYIVCLAIQPSIYLVSICVTPCRIIYMFFLLLFIYNEIMYYYHYYYYYQLKRWPI